MLIEQIWNYLKVKIRGKKFNSKNDLFKALKEEWYNIPNDVIHNLYSSYWARCYVCVQNNGDCLNSHWEEVRQIHDSYRQ